ncbi:lipopolysaccharide biosynthesis protein [Rhodococcoides fascians]|uniref:lipopolysaccharide biosynthesis protein n=1 Tax=Rhodococcoides fascians TaxID=1828 RepID=UPI003CEAD8AA
MSGGTRVLSLPVTAACSFASTAVIINFAGATGFAAISVVNTMFMLIQFTDLGLGSGVINAVSSSILTWREKHGVVASTFRLLVIVSMVLLVGAASGLVFFSWSAVLGIAQSGLANLNAATFAALALFAMALPFSVGQRILTGISRNHVAILLSMVTSIVSLLVVVAVYAAKWPAAFMSISQSAGLLVSAVLSCAVGMKAIRFRYRYLLQRRLYRATGLMVSGLWMLLLSVCIAFAFQSGRLMLAHRSSDAQLASYSLIMQFYLPVISVMSATGLALWPMFSSKRGHMDSARNEVMRLTLIFAGVGAVLSVGFACLIRPVSSLLSGGEIVLSWPLIFVVCLLICAQSAQVVPGMFLTSSEGLKFQALCGLGAVVVSLSISWVLTPAVGSSGPVIATCASVFFAQFVPTYLKAVK